MADIHNNIEIFKKNLQRIGALEGSQIPVSGIDEGYLRKNDPVVFLKLIHYIVK